MKFNETKHSEEFWIDVVEACVDEGEPLICVPVGALDRKTAVELALKLDITVFIKSNDYMFSTSMEATQYLFDWNDETLH